MKIIIINSKKYGKHEVFVDDEDYELVMQQKWRLKKKSYTNYAFCNYYKEDGKRSVIDMHRYILNSPNGFFIDHIDHNGLNNQKYNLRICTQAQNNKNKTSSKNSSSKYLGVMIRKREKKTTKYYVTICHNRKIHYLGYFPYTPEGEIAAAKAYDEAAKKYHGEFANLNFK